MCGIFGVINTKEKIDEGRVLAARDILAHRGPDDKGIYLSSNNERSPASPDVSGQAARDCGSTSPFVALAHRRLSIIDLSPAAHQPMTTPDGRYTIVYNGEIYNYLELSQKLKVKSKKLSSNSDTEIILNLYIDYGKDCLEYLRGMFAFAIWDNNEKTLFAARDRFGIKPFYYLKNDNEFIFSSELKAIKHYKKNLTNSREGIDAFLRTGSVPAPLTIYEKVSSMLPGHWLEWKMENVKCQKYWDFTDLFEKSAGQNAQYSMLSVQSAMDKIPTASKLSIEHSKFNIKKSKSVYDSNAKKRIRAALLDSVRSHLVSDVEVGAFLSGGIDSTAIVSLMRQVGQEKIKTVSIVFPGNNLDESKYARLAAKKYNTEHIEIPFYEKDLIDDFEKIMASMDQPTIDGINTYFVSKAAKQAGLKVVLSGLGGDELFGGYSSFINIPKYQRIKNIPFAKTLMKAAAPLVKNKLPAKAIEYFKNPDSQNAEYKLMRGLFTNSELNSMGWSVPVISTNEERRNLKISQSMTPSSEGMPVAEMTRDPMPYALSNLQYISMMETTFYMRNQLLRDSDVFSMAHSLELRVPFVDHLLYESVLPYLDSAFDKFYPKKMLVDAVGDIPLELINRPKMGFTFPFSEWMSSGQLKDLIIEKIKDSSIKFKIDHSKLNIEGAHWSRLWALYVLSKFI